MGDTFNLVALALLIYDLTGSGVGVSGVVVAEIMPVLLLAPVAGPLADRWPRVRVMIGSDLCRVGLAPVAGILVVTAGYAPAFAINAASYAASTLVLRGLRVPDVLQPRRGRRWWADARAEP